MPASRAHRRAIGIARSAGELPLDETGPRQGKARSRRVRRDDAVQAYVELCDEAVLAARAGTLGHDLRRRLREGLDAATRATDWPSQASQRERVRWAQQRLRAATRGDVVPVAGSQPLRAKRRARATDTLVGGLVPAWERDQGPAATATRPVTHASTSSQSRRKRPSE